MKSLMMKLMAIFGLMVFTICTVFLLFSASRSSQNLLEVGEEGFLGLRDSWSIALHDSIVAEEYLLETIARRTDLTNQNLSLEQRLDYLQPDLVAGKEMGYLNFGLIEPNGTVYLTDGNTMNGAGQDYFTMPMKGENFVGDPYLSEYGSSAGTFMQIISVPLLVNSRPVGVLVLFKDGTALSDFVKEFSENVTGAGVIFSLRTGVIIGHIDQRIGDNILETAKTNPSLKALESIVLALMRGESGVQEYTSSTGYTRLAFYEPIQGIPWGLMVYNNIEEVRARSQDFTFTMIIFSIIILLIALVITFVIARNISMPIKTATEQIQYLAEGDLTFENNLPHYEKQKDEVGTIARSLHGLKDSLSSVFKDILNGAQQVASGSRQISTTSQSVSSVASEQAASTEEISSTMEEMAANIKQNADNATKTGSISKQAVENAHKGQEAVNESLESVKKIASEISIIGSIASQTNLLALNAAIEAARAGEAGKGFAVVASEVRKLAEKSQIAATEINKLSTTTIVSAEKAGEVIATVIPGIEQTASLVEEISFASREQDTGASQVNSALVQMDVGVQQNASSSEELASMAEELSSQAMQLIETLGFFKLDESSSKTKKPAVKFIQDPATTANKKAIKKIF